MENETTLSKDLTNKAQWVCDLMKQDGVKPEQVTDEMCIAYLQTVNKKIQMIQSKLLTDQNAKKEFGEGGSSHCKPKPSSLPAQG